MSLLLASRTRVPCRRVFPALLLALFAAAISLPAPVHAAAEAPVSLETLLRDLDRASRLYLDSALRFSCDETISHIGPGWSTQRFSYIYVYDDKKGFVDYRTRLGRKLPVDPADHGVLLFLDRAYFWVLIFSASRQPLHRYEIQGEEAVMGQKAIRIGFEALPPFEKGLNDWTGTAWIDLRSLQILRVKAAKAEDLAARDRIEKGIAGGPGVPRPAPGSQYTLLEVTTEFSVEKNGMRFPGTVEITRTTFRVPRLGAPKQPQKAGQEWARQVYTNYRFFGVRSREEIVGILNGEKPGKPAR